MATLKEFEEALREQGMRQALRILERLRERDRKARAATAAPRRVAARKMTPELARKVLELHGSTRMTQQEIAWELGVNQGRVNEVVRHGKWLAAEAEAGPAPRAPRARGAAALRSGAGALRPAREAMPAPARAAAKEAGQLTLF